MNRKSILSTRIERNYVDDVYNKLCSKRVIACRSVPILGRCADLVYIVKDSVISVEFKLHNWRKAIIQAIDHRLAANYAYICMPPKKITVQMKGEIEKAGVGLFFYNENSEWPLQEIVVAPKSTEVWDIARNKVQKYVLANGDKGCGSHERVTYC